MKGTAETGKQRWERETLDPALKRSPERAQTFTTISGRPIDAIRGLTITTIDASGAYSGMGGPMATSPRLVPGYRLLGAIVEGPGGNVFVKLTGPAKTIAANRQKFEQLLTSFQPDK